MNRVEGWAWMLLALRLDREARELRMALTDVLFWISDREELAAYAAELIEERFGEAA